MIKYREILEEQLRLLLKVAVKYDQEYEEREAVLYSALYYAKQLEIPCGFRIDPKELEWPVLYFELPTGQVSWHMPQHEKEWDGHSTLDKFDRIKDYVNSRIKTDTNTRTDAS